MKKLLIAVIALTATASVNAAEVMRAEVNGMVCAFCAVGIEKKLKAMPSTRATYINLEKKIVAVAFKDGQSATAEAIAARIQDAGYDVVRIGASTQSLDEIRRAATERK